MTGLFTASGRSRLTTPQELRIAAIAIMVAGRMKAPDLLEIVRRIANDRGAAAAMLLTADTRSIDAVQDAARRALESSSGQPYQGSFKGVGARTRAATAPAASSRPAP